MSAHLEEGDIATFARDGAWLSRRGALDALPSIRAALDLLPRDKAGVRIGDAGGLHRHLDAHGCIGSLAAAVLGEECRAVRAVLFDKTKATNWSLAWHQDRTIAVAERVEVEGFGPWTTKQGIRHVAPPFAVLERMLTLRVHLDDVPACNAPLRVAVGSHRLGPVGVRDVEAVVHASPILTCLAEAGDVWLYATPILHASDAAISPGTRRVLQVDYAADDLRGGLQWLGV